jgi:hypothetical protein
MGEFGKPHNSFFEPGERWEVSLVLSWCPPGQHGDAVELREIIDRYVEGIEAIDRMSYPPRVNARTKEPYLPGAFSMSEVDLIARIDDWWGATYPGDFTPRGAHRTGVPYPDQPKLMCDQVLTTDGNLEEPEWAIEVKRPSFIGDNGKGNDYGVGKVLSPFLKDRSLYHDVLRLRENPLARRCAVIVVTFEYSQETCEEAAQRHPGEIQRIREIEKVLRTNRGALSVKPVADFADGIFRVRELVTGVYHHAKFQAWQHPCGGHGVVFGWELLLPGQENTW